MMRASLASSRGSLDLRSELSGLGVGLAVPSLEVLPLATRLWPTSRSAQRIWRLGLAKIDSCGLKTSERRIRVDADGSVSTLSTPEAGHLLRVMNMMRRQTKRGKAPESRGA